MNLQDMANESYKKVFIDELKKEAVALIERGYSIDADQYPEDQISMIRRNSEVSITQNQKRVLNAKADFELLKQNKIPDVVIANKLINDTSYKKTMISLFEKMGDDLVKNGQSIPDVNSYAKQKVNNIIDNVKHLSTEEKINSIKEYEQKNNISAEYVVKTFEDNNIVTKNINALTIQDILSIECDKNLLSVERTDLNDNLYPFLTENNKLIFAPSIEYTAGNVVPLNQNDAISYYQNMLNEKDIEFNEFSKKMSSFLDKENKNNQIRFENAHYLINELDKNPEKFSQFSTSFIEKGISENALPDSNIKVGENIKEALKDKVNPQFTFVETVKKKVIKETKLLIDIVDNTKKILLEKPLKSIQDKLFNKAMDDAEKKLEHQQNNQKSNQREKSKNAQVSL
ncbi:hypothetical protein A9G43_00925 [Gilliamella sp. Occ3-1]|uniref:hypothetical protein n=1 Tax=Gilliamella sp. Occ3-1 TaxID=3120253 RepID=UPI00080E6EEF|nr:hypothetical protein [Gilliamella apicola]OCG69515.1 hypothetical protein A9G43_00925 [Gilliamella apicola]